MKFYGHANLQKNELQNAALTTLTAFPASPVVGMLAFVNSIVFICISTVNSLPIWVPLTREITAFTYTQPSDSASSTWTITHDLNTTSVQVQVFDGSGLMIIPDSVTVVDASTVTITFLSPATGRAVLLSGHFDGNMKPTYAFTFYQSSASATWTIAHGLGYNPIVRTFIGNQEVQPLTTTFPDVNTVILTFSTAQVGYARLI